MVIDWLIQKVRNKHGGGVCFYLRNTITFCRQYQLENDDLELIALEIQKANSCLFLIATWYRPPNTPLDYFKKFEMFLKEADARYSEIYILGDLNYNILSNPKEVHTTHLLIINLAQLIKEPTNRKLVLMYLLGVIGAQESAFDMLVRRTSSS